MILPNMVITGIYYRWLLVGDSSIIGEFLLGIITQPNRGIPSESPVNPQHTETGPGLGLELGILDLAPWSLRCLRVMAASTQHGLGIPCHSSSFPVRIPMAPCFPMFHAKSWKQRLRDPTVFVGFLQQVWLPFAPRNVFVSFICLRSGNRQKTGCCFVDHELTPIRPPGTQQTECSSEGLSSKWVELIGKSFYSGVSSVLQAWESLFDGWVVRKYTPTDSTLQTSSNLQTMDSSFLLVLIRPKFDMFMEWRQQWTWTV